MEVGFFFLVQRFLRVSGVWLELVFQEKMVAVWRYESQQGVRGGSFFGWVGGVYFGNLILLKLRGIRDTGQKLKFGETIVSFLVNYRLFFLVFFFSQGQGSQVGEVFFFGFIVECRQSGREQVYGDLRGLGSCSFVFGSVQNLFQEKIESVIGV